MREEYQDIGAEGVRRYTSDRHESEYLLVDVRQPDEYARGHIPGAVLMPLGEINERVHQLPMDRDIIFYCRSGKRSRGAAILVGSQPYVAGTVFNMTDGILAWEGHLLPTAPELKVYDLTVPQEDLLLQAMDLERGAERFYTALRQRYGDMPWAQDLAALAGAEEAHARMIHRAWAADRDNPPPFATVYAGLSGDIIEGGMPLVALVAALEQQPLEPCRMTLEMALTIEYGAYDLSRNLAYHFRGQPLEEVFNVIAAAEREHIQLVARGLAFCET